MTDKNPTEEDINRILDDMNGSGEIDYFNIPGIVDILKVHLKNEILKHWKEENRVAFSYCENCGTIQFIKIEAEWENGFCKHCNPGELTTNFVSSLCDEEDESIPDDFEEPFDLKKWAKEHKEFMRKNRLRVK